VAASILCDIQYLRLMSAENRNGGNEENVTISINDNQSLSKRINVGICGDCERNIMRMWRWRHSAREVRRIYQAAVCILRLGWAGCGGGSGSSEAQRRKASASAKISSDAVPKKHENGCAYFVIIAYLWRRSVSQYQRRNLIMAKMALNDNRREAKFGVTP